MCILCHWQLSAGWIHILYPTQPLTRHVCAYTYCLQFACVKGACVCACSSTPPLSLLSLCWWCRKDCSSHWEKMPQWWDSATSSACMPILCNSYANITHTHACMYKHKHRRGNIRKHRKCDVKDKNIENMVLYLTDSDTIEMLMKVW